MARRPKEVEDRREQIIDAAMRVFAQKGFTRATNKDIAQEAGITPGLIYHYFENKEAVFKAIVEARSPLRLIQTLPAQMLTEPPEVFLRFVVAQVLTVVEGEQFLQLLRMALPEFLHNPKMAPVGLSVLQQAISFLEGYLAAKMESGELRRAEASLSAQLFISSVMGFVLRRQILRDPLALHYSQEQIVEEIVNTILKGLLPR